MARKREWFDDDLFWRDMYTFMFPQGSFDAASEKVDQIIQLARPKGTEVLDLCCGPGKYAVPLARRGFAVTGLDRTKYLLDKARARAKAAKVKIKWIAGDMRDFIRRDSFDLIINMTSSFGYFDNKGEDILVLENIFKNLHAGGVCVIEIMGKEQLAAIYRETLSSDLPDGRRLVQRHKIIDDWTRIWNEWILIRKGKVKSYRFHLTIYSGQEIRDRLERAGFIGIKLYGGLDGRAYGRGMERLVAVARKPAKRTMPERTRRIQPRTSN